MKLTLSLTLLLASSVIAQSSSESSAASVEAASTQTATTSAVESSVAASSTRTGTRSASGTRSAASATASTNADTQQTVTTVIPDGTSQRCKTFLNKLNSDSNVASFLGAMSSATAGFSSSNLASTLDTLCKSGISDTTIRGYLSSFADECKEELTGASPNTDVRQLYDTLYVISPLRGAICTKDPNTQGYCLLKTSSKAQARSVHNLSPRLSSQQPDMTSYKNSGILFPGINQSTEAANLCVTCTQSVLAVWATWQRQVIHAFGINNSVILGGEAGMYEKVQDTCGAGFVSVVNSVSSTGSSNSSGAALDIPGLQSLMATLMALGAWVVL